MVAHPLSTVVILPTAFTECGEGSFNTSRGWVGTLPDKHVVEKGEASSPALQFGAGGQRVDGLARGTLLVHAEGPHSDEIDDGAQGFSHDDKPSQSYRCPQVCTVGC